MNLLSSTLKGNIVQQAASKLLKHLELNRNFYNKTHNNNTNAFTDNYYQSSTHLSQNKKDFRRTNKCRSWLSNYPTHSDTSLNRSPFYPESSLHKPKSRDYLSKCHIYPQNRYSFVRLNPPHYKSLQLKPNPLILSSNAILNDDNGTHSQYDSSFQPLVMVHKKRLHCDRFLSTMQNCTQLPYSQNHFYAFDQANMVKLQRNIHSNLKRKYFDSCNDDKSQYHCSDIQPDQRSPSKKHVASSIEQTSNKTIDHISVEKCQNEFKSDNENQTNEQSHFIVSHLEKILDLCTELRSLAKDVETNLNKQTTQKLDTEEKNPTDASQSEPTTIDIYKELDVPPINNEPLINDIVSLHSESNKSHQLMPTESFKTKSPSLTTSHTTLRKSEDICSCFLKSFMNKENCPLSIDEQEYLNELTKAYLLGRQHREENNHFPTEKRLESNHDSSSTQLDTNNNNQSITPVSPSSIIFYNNFQKSNDHLSTISETSNDSRLLFQENEQQQQLSTSSDILSIKHQIFINEPIAMKAITVLPGIGSKYAQQLAQCGFSTVRRLLGFYLIIKDDQQFVVWLNNKVGISTHSAWLCTNALRAWCKTNL